ncbi:hypothetical protein HDU84_000005 [Entophlyctis sp. JEL0112]|nr:hypothetical protein HDU84_000005 [Entophlyctis sp. JEL0112]
MQLGLRAAAVVARHRFVSSSAAPRTVGAFSREGLAYLLPKTSHLSANSTLGEVWDAVYTKYPYRLAYPVLLWATFLWYNLWVPEISAAEKKALKERIDYLKSLEFHQA